MDDLTTARSDDERNVVARTVMRTFSRWFLIAAPLAMAALYVWQVAALPVMQNAPVVSPRAWPSGAAVVLCVSAVLIATGALFTLWKVVPKTPGSDIGSWRDVLVTLGATAVFALVVTPLGYVISSFLLVAGCSFFVSPRRWIRNVVVAALFAVLSSVLFVGLLDVRLPDGILPVPW